MASNEKLNVEITATDKASKPIDDVAKKVDALEAEPHEVTIAADDQATDEVTALDKRLEGLTGEDRELILKAQAKQAQSEIDSVTRTLADAQKYDDDAITVLVEARDNAKGKLDQVQAELRALDGDTAKVTVEADTASLDDVAGKLAELEGPIGDIGGQLGKLASPGGAVAALGAGLILAGNAAADTAIEADNLARLTGDSVEDASRLAAVWKTSGADVSDLSEAMANMAGVLQDTPEIAARLGINLNDGKTMGERFTQVIGAANAKITDASERTLILGKLFGETGVRQVNEMVGAVGDLDQAIAAVPDASVVSPEEVENAREFKQQMRELTADVTAFAAAVGSVVVPVMGGLVGVFNKGFTGAEEFGRNVRGLFDGGAADEARVYAEAIDTAEGAARSFDKTTLDNAKSLDEVRAIAAEYANGALADADAQLHATNLIANEWNRTLEDEAAAAAAAQKEADRLAGTYSMAGEAARGTAQMTEGLSEAERVAADALDEASAAADRKKAALDALYSANLQLVGGDIAVRDAQRDAAVATLELSTALEESGGNAFLQEQAIDAATAAQLAAAQAAVDYTVKQSEASGATVDQATQAGLMASELRTLQAGMEPGSPLWLALQGYIDQLNAIPRTITSTIEIKGQSYTINKDGDIIGYRGPRAAGGPVRPGGYYGIVEKGMPEMLTDDAGNQFLIPGRPGQVTPMQPMSGASATGAPGVAPIINFNIEVDAGFSSPTEVGQRIVDAIDRHIRSGGRLTFLDELERRIRGAR